MVERLREEAFAEGGNELTYVISPQVTWIKLSMSQDVVLRALILKLGMTLVFAIADVARSL